ncbi:MAG: hypothetical protein GXY44_02375 [Phycisphaerales bacterium]|nr:hypothetical protein [Phycisphaerales bacterium]
MHAKQRGLIGVGGVLFSLFCTACSPIEVGMIEQDRFATISHRQLPGNRIGYRFHEHEPIIYGPVPSDLVEAGIEPTEVDRLEQVYSTRPKVVRYVVDLSHQEGWAPQQWTFYLAPTRDGVDLLLIIETQATGLNNYYGIQQCFRLTGETNAAWRHAVALTPAFSEFDLWAEEAKNNAPRTSLSYVLRTDVWEPLPPKHETVGARTPHGVEIDSMMTGGRLEKMPLVGPYNAEMGASIDSGLVSRVNREKTWVCGIYWERTSHVTNHHPADCLHSIVNIGGLPPYGKRAIRGKIYWFSGSLDDLIRRWKRDFSGVPY